MKEKLMKVLQPIKRFLWGTYSGMRQCVYLLLLLPVLFEVGLPVGIGSDTMTDVILLSMIYAIIHNWLAVFMPRTGIVKSGAIAYAVYMLSAICLYAICLYYNTGYEMVPRRQFPVSVNIWGVIFAPVFTILLTVVERFFADKLQGWWRRIVKWLYNGIAILPLLAVAALFMWQWYTDYSRKHRFADNDTIERITGVAFPELEIIDYKKGQAGFTGDYSDELTLEMEEELSESTYHYLDSIISAGNAEWSKSNNEYSYSRMWGNGLPAPEGESDDEDITLSLSFRKGSMIITLNSGSW